MKPEIPKIIPAESRSSPNHGYSYHSSPTATGTAGAMSKAVAPYPRYPHLWRSTVRTSICVASGIRERRVPTKNATEVDRYRKILYQNSPGLMEEHCFKLFISQAYRPVCEVAGDFTYELGRAGNTRTSCVGTQRQAFDGESPCLKNSCASVAACQLAPRSAYL